jgi:hypothetical protein
MCPLRSRTIRPLASLMPSASILLLSLLLGTSGCSNDGGTAPIASTNRIGPDGGTATSADGGAAVTIPPGALSTVIDFAIAPAASPPSGALTGTCYDFGPEGTAFIQPVTLALEYDPGTIPAGATAADLQLARAASGVWIPLADSSVDSLSHVLHGTTSQFSTYGIKVGGTIPDHPDSLIVKLVDSPGPGTDDEFSSLSDAIAYLQAHLDSEALGVIQWRTDQPQAVASLIFLFDLRIDVEAGRTATVNGPSVTPLVMDAGGAVDLSTLTIQAPAGLVLNANRRVDLAGVHLPSETAVNIGGVKGAPCPAAEPGFVSKSAAAKQRAAGAAIAGCDLGDDFSLNLGGGTTLQGDFQLTGNHGAHAAVAGAARLSGASTLDFLDNALKVIDVDVKAEAQAGLSLRGNTGLDDLDVVSDLTGTHQITFQGNVAAAARVKLAGIGSATITLSNEHIGNGQWEWGLKDLQLDAASLNLDNLVVVGVATAITPHVAADFVSSTITQNLQFDLMDSDAGHLTLGLSHVSLHDVSVTTRYEVEHQFDDVTVSGHAQFTFHGDLVDWSQSHCTYEVGAQVDAGDVAGGVSIISDADHFTGSTSFLMPPSVSFTLSLTHGFMEGGTLGASPSYRRKTVVAAAGRRDGGGITLDDLTWDGEGYEHIDLETLDVPVTVTNCNFHQTGDPGAIMTLVEMGGEIQISGNTFDGGGFGVTDCPSSVTVTGNQIHPTSAATAGITLGGCGTATVSGNTVHCGTGAAGAVAIDATGATTTLTGNTLDGVSASLCCLFGGGTVMCDGNDLISGGVSILDCQVHMSGNTFANATVVDDYIEPGLMNDPVQDNDGLNPDDCATRMDWDGNGCCDYPPEWNLKDEYGHCICEGVPAKGD